MTLPAFLKTWAFPIACLGLVGIIVIIGLMTGDFGRVGPDNDDMMRLIQIRDYYVGGQGWFDTQQYRMGPEGGTVMHWSRLVDIPILFLIAFFDIFMTYPAAESLAISIWPPLSAVIVFAGIYIGAKNLAGTRAGWFAAAISALFLLGHYRFEAGAIDHHNVQIGLLCLSLGLALDPKYAAKAFLGSGIAMGLSVSIGADIYLFGGLICAFVALSWLLKGAEAREGVIAFGAGLGGALIFSFFSVVGPDKYFAVACDALSLITVSAGALGGLGLSLAAWKFSENSLKARLLALVGLGGLCTILFLLQAPQCLSNPLSELSPDVQELWLGNITEAKPLFNKPMDFYLTGPVAIGGALLALFYCGMKIWHKRNWAFALPAALLLCAIALAVYQARFYVFAQFFAFIILGVWAAELYAKNDGAKKRSLAYIAVLFFSVPYIWGIPGAFLVPTDASNQNAVAKKKAKACYSVEVMEDISSLPPGRVAAVNNATAFLLKDTEHSALGGNYHRNASGIEAMIEIFTSDPKRAHDILQQQAIDYVLICSATKESSVLKNHSPDGLMAYLLDGEIPSYLEPWNGGFSTGTISVYRVTQIQTAREE